MIEVLYLTGEFIEINNNPQDWKLYLQQLDIPDVDFLTRRAFLDKAHFNQAPDLLQQDFEIHSCENADYALAMDVIEQVSKPIKPEAMLSKVIIPFCKTDIRPLLKILREKLDVIIIANKPQPENYKALCSQWIDLSTKTSASDDSTSTDLDSTLEVLEPDEAFWKDKIQKSLGSFVDSKNGVVDVSLVLQWIYSLQLGCNISAIREQQIAIDTQGRGILKSFLPVNLRWEEEGAGVPARIRDVRRKENQPLSAVEAINQLQLGIKTPISENVLPENTLAIAHPNSIGTNIDHIIEGSDLLAHHCRWAIQREELIRQKADYQTQIAPTDSSFLRQAQELDVYIWTIRNPLAKPEEYEQLGECYDTLLAAFRFLKQVEQSRPIGFEGKELLKNSAQLAANAQCILKTQLRSLGREITIDPLQSEAFRYLRELGNRESCFLYNMKTQEELPRENAPEIVNEIALLQELHYSKSVESKQKRNLLGKVEYHVKQLKEGNSPAEQWGKIIAASTELCTDYNMPPSDLFFRQQLEPLIDVLPEDVDSTDEFGRIIQEIEIHRARVMEAEEMEAFGALLPDNVPTPAVERVRDMFGGTRMIFIGGEPKEHIIKRIEERFNVTLIWNSTNHSESLSRFDGALNDPDVSLFLIYIPWCSHKHSEELAQIVSKSGKQLVRLRKGTNPDVIAEAICQQVPRPE